MKIYDLTAPISPSLVVWEGDPPVDLSHVAHLDHGDDYTVTRMDMGARLRSGDPPARPIGQRDAAVQRKGQLERDMRAAEARASEIAV